MALVPRVGIVLFFILFLQEIWAERIHNTLNMPQLLLPYAASGSDPVNFTLKAVDGCYSWSSNRPDVVTVEPLYLDFDDENAKPYGKQCSRSAIVTVQRRQSEKQMAEVIAEEEVTGLLLECDVFVAKIERIDITSTSRELFLGEAPTVLEVQAFDAEDNMFSTLGALAFTWDLITVDGPSSVSANSIIRIMSFEDSTYETTPEIYGLEARSLRGSEVIIEPINTGTAKVRAKLRESIFEDVKPSTVKLVVLDKVLLRPAYDMYIMINTCVKYTVVRLRQGQATVLQMPSPQFQFKLMDNEAGYLDVQKSSVTGIKEGVTKIVLVDKSILLQKKHYL
ncbi:predicted protein [Nematostella vectensis]|uniref:Uncharacterized protein n=1 Tax=Nematostella vectensis TaxID=45351 RepID=A7S9P0_NEMVE|nr:predicted protein [Nematostella vectensis]|eukprot:XP_001631704.1 predicted protein [Nematostella vectensis]